MQKTTKQYATSWRILQLPGLISIQLLFTPWTQTVWFAGMRWGTLSSFRRGHSNQGYLGGHSINIPPNEGFWTFALQCCKIQPKQLLTKFVCCYGWLHRKLVNINWRSVTESAASTQGPTIWHPLHPDRCNRVSQRTLGNNPTRSKPTACSHCWKTLQTPAWDWNWKTKHIHDQHERGSKPCQPLLPTVKMAHHRQTDKPSGWSWKVGTNTSQQEKWRR